MVGCTPGLNSQGFGNRCHRAFADQPREGIVRGVLSGSLWNRKMATQKEHHYVPQFFFRNFSRHPKRTTIHALLTRHGTVKFDVSIKKQCKRRKLYVSQETEDALAQVETNMSSCLRSVIRNVANFPTLRNSLSIVHQMGGAFLLQSSRVPTRGQRCHDAILPLFEELTISQLLANPQTPLDLREKLAGGAYGIDYD